MVPKLGHVCGTLHHARPRTLLTLTQCIAGRNELRAAGVNHPHRLRRQSKLRPQVEGFIGDEVEGKSPLIRAYVILRGARQALDLLVDVVERGVCGEPHASDYAGWRRMFEWQWSHSRQVGARSGAATTCIAV
eukprot:1106225-Prymnesium_polylepis.2